MSREMLSSARGILAVVGSRDFPQPDMVTKWVRENAESFTSFVSGGAEGPDDLAHRAWLETIGPGHDKIFKADWKRYGRGAGFLRNIKIIDAATFVVCFWTNHSSGTLDDLGLLFNCGKPFNLYVR